MKSTPLKATDLDALVNKGKRKFTDLEKILQSEKIIKEYVQNEIVFSKPILTWKDQPFIFPNTLNSVVIFSNSPINSGSAVWSKSNSPLSSLTVLSYSFKQNFA